MIKFWRLMAHEYSRHVLQKRFVFALLSVPAFVVLVIALVYLLIFMEINNTPIGYIDQSGLLANPIPQSVPQPPEKPISMLPFSDETAARKALQAGEIQGYYIIPADYLQAGALTQVYLTQIKEPAEDQFYEFLDANLLAAQPKEISHRILDGTRLVIRSADASRETSRFNILTVMLPFLVAMIFFFAMNTSSGYLMSAVVEEKENRTMEILVTSASPTQIMAGKIIGDILVGLTQLLGWSLFSLLGIMVVIKKTYWLQGISITNDLLLLTLVIMLPAFVMVCALMAAVGATVTETREGQQVMGLFTIPIYLPFILLPTLMQNPNSPLAVALSYIPFTAPLTMALRVGFSQVPAYQMITSSVTLFLCAGGALWLAGRAFRLGMLSYGRRLRLRELFQRRRIMP